jgi:DNA-binding transcriptional ArsR family regulator
MPLHVTAERDPITPLIHFRTSAVFQTLVSIQAATHPWRHKDWTRRVNEELGEDFYTRLKALYQKFHNGCDFAEMAIDYAGDDFSGFLDYVESLSSRNFVFYVLGRVYRLEEIPEILTEESIYRLVEEHGNLDHFQHIGVTFEWAADVPALQRNLIDLWRTYWQEFFESKLPDFQAIWERGMREKEEILYRQGGTVLLEQITGCSELPPPIPEDQPFTTVQLVPACLMPRSSVTYYGYGNITVLYDCTRSEEVDAEIEKSKDRALAMLRALADENRLKILRLISEEELAYNGRKIADKLNLSPSVVSRHLSQLKEAGLVAEQSPDNRNILYMAQREKINELPKLLLRYLYD